MSHIHKTAKAGLKFLESLHLLKERVLDQAGAVLLKALDQPFRRGCAEGQYRMTTFHPPGDLGRAGCSSNDRAFVGLSAPVVGRRRFIRESQVLHGSTGELTCLHLQAIGGGNQAECAKEWSRIGAALWKDEGRTDIRQEARPCFNRKQKTVPSEQGPQARRPHGVRLGADQTAGTDTLLEKPGGFGAGKTFEKLRHQIGEEGARVLAVSCQ